MAPKYRGLRSFVCSPSCGGSSKSSTTLMEDDQFLASGELGQDLFRGVAVLARASGGEVVCRAVPMPEGNTRVEGAVPCRCAG